MSTPVTQAHIRHIKDQLFSCTGSNPNASFTISGAAPPSPPSGNETASVAARATPPANPATRPMETVLIALATCSSLDIIHILKKSKQAFTTFEVAILGTRQTAIPQVFTAIELTFHITCPANRTNSANSPSQQDVLTQKPTRDHNKITRAIHLGLYKYCSVATMLARAGVTITHKLSLKTIPAPLEKLDAAHR